MNSAQCDDFRRLSADLRMSNLRVREFIRASRSLSKLSEPEARSIAKSEFFWRIT